MTVRRPHRAGDWFRILPIREEPTFAVLPLLARALEAELRKFADDRGVIDLGARSAAEAVALFGGARSRSERRQLHGLLVDLEQGGAIAIAGGRLTLLRMVAEGVAAGLHPVLQTSPSCTEPVLSLSPSGTEVGSQLDITSRNLSGPEGYIRGDQRRREEIRGEEILPSVGSPREEPDPHGSSEIQKFEPSSRPDPGSAPTGLDLNPIATTSSTGSPTPVVPAPADDAEPPASERKQFESPELRKRAVEVHAICDAMRADVAAGVPVATALPRFLTNLGVPLQGAPEPSPAKARREHKPPTRRAPRVRPVGWEPSAAHVEQGARLGFRKHRVIGEAEKFTGHWDAAGKMWADWDAAFGCWLRKAREIDDRNGVPYDEPCEPLFADRRHVIPGDQETLPEELRGLTVEQMQAKMKERVRLVVEAKKRFAKLAAQPAEEVH